MKFVLTKTSDIDFREIIEINTLNDLMSLQEKYQHELIISIASSECDKRWFPETEGRYIEIYDFWRE